MKSVAVLLLARGSGREMVRRSLVALRDIEIVGECTTREEASALMRSHNAVVLADFESMGEESLQIIMHLGKENSGARAVMLVPPPASKHVSSALCHGVSALLPSDGEAEELGLALQAADRGASYFPAEISKPIVTAFLRHTERPNGESAGPNHLSPRQTQTLRFIAEGYSTKEIAGLLGISPKTVEAHRTELMRRLDIHDIAGLVRYAVRVGLVQAT